MTEKRWRTVQPAHPSENVAVEQAREAWRKTWEQGVGKPGASRVPLSSGEQAADPAIPAEADDREKR